MKRLIMILAVITIPLSVLSCSRSPEVNRVPVAKSRPSPSPQPTEGETYVRLRVVDSLGSHVSDVGISVSPTRLERQPVGKYRDGAVRLISPCNTDVIITFSVSSFLAASDVYSGTSHMKYVPCGEQTVDLGDMTINCICPDCRKAADLKLTIDRCDRRRNLPD
jgi:hypothetical protein